MSSWLLMGAARSGVSDRRGGCGMDRDRTGARHLRELENCGETNFADIRRRPETPLRFRPFSATDTATAERFCSPSVRCFIVIFFIPYTASGFAACGKLFASLFGVNYIAAMVISAVVIVGYTALGGFLAASTTDFIQSIIMSIALIIVFVFWNQCCGRSSGRY